jgi:hypothetical protein
MRFASFTGIASLLTLALITPLGRAQQYIGLDPSSLKFQPAQNQNEWTWAAAVQTVLSAYGIDLDQRSILDRIMGNVQGPDVGGAISQTLSGQALDREGRMRFISSVVVPGMPTSASLLDELSQKHPILALWGDPLEPRAAVIVGAYYVSSQTGPQIVALNVDGRFMKGDELPGWARQVSKSWITTVK